MSKRILAVSLGLFLSATLSFGQTATGSIGGSVADSNGGGVPGAKMTATNVASGQKLETVSNEIGIYAFPTVPTGVLRNMTWLGCEIFFVRNK